MVAGKVKMAMGINNNKPSSPATPKTTNSKPQSKPTSKNQPLLPSPSSGKAAGTKSGLNTQHPPPPSKTAFARSFGVYFPRSSAQVQPRPPDVAELLRRVEDLRERESRLKTELLSLKLVRESAALVPILEHEISIKNTEIQKRDEEIDRLRSENEKLRAEVEQSQNRARELTRTTALREQRVTESMEGDDLTASQRFQGLIDAAVKSNLIKNLRKGGKQSATEVVAGSVFSGASLRREETTEAEKLEELVEVSVRSRAPRVPKPPPKPISCSYSSNSDEDVNVAAASSPETMAGKENRAPPPPPPPPPQPSVSSMPVVKKAAPVPPPPPPLPKPQIQSQTQSKSAAAPPPPPPPANVRGVTAKVRRVPEVVEFYHSLMRRDSRRDAGNIVDAPVTNCARDMIGEIENRSAYLLAIKTDVETQGDFIRFLIKEVGNAAFSSIEDVVPFVKWLDDELSYLVDERAVLKHFEWPEQKADTLREAAFGYSDLKKLESEASSFEDDVPMAFPHALKKMQTLYDKLEHGIYTLSRMRESAANRYKLHQIPMDWMLETGLASQIKLASVKLAMKYMQRVSAELEHVDGRTEEEELIVQGVRFAFRVHQFAGGFDAETMKAFKELREKARTCHQHQQEQQRFLCRSTTMSS